MKNPKDDMDIEVMEAFTSMKSDQEIGMPDVDEELAKLKAVRVKPHVSPFRTIAASVAIIVAVSSIAVAAVVNREAIANFFAGDNTPVAENAAAIPAELQIVPNDTIMVTPGVVMFENNELVEIMTSISNGYKKEVVFKTEAVKHIHLHFQYNTEEKLEQVLQSLNMFEKISVKLNNNKLEVE